MLAFHHVDFTYPGEKEKILDGLSFQVQDGEFISILGASGGGKSTLFRLLNGLETIQGGSIEIDGKNIRDLKHYCSYMPQRDLLFPWRTVEQNVMLPMEIAGVDKAKRKKDCGHMLRRVELEPYAKKYPRDLSGGMRQRVSFARTLCAGSNLLLLDEPFSALDSITRINLQEWLLRQWGKFNRTVLFITHDVEEAIFLSQKIYVLKEKPIRTVEQIEVPLPYPRTRDMLLQPEIMRLKEELIRALRQKVEA